FANWPSTSATVRQGPAGGDAQRACVSTSIVAAKWLWPAPGPTVRAAVARGLLLVHGSAIAAAAVLAQLKGDAWWDGLAAWYLAAGPQSRLPWLLPAFAASEYLTNLVTHAVTLGEVSFAVGLWWRPTRRIVARGGLLFWPLLGLLAGEPFWGVTMALFGVPSAVESPDDGVSHPA
ncbi:MAG: hypothetical protein ACKOTB_06460, partial [Planctomycetia bacterium]